MPSPDKPIRESQIEDYLVKRVKALGGEVRKVKWIGRPHAPDRVVWLPEVVSVGPAGVIPAKEIWVELKRPGAKARPGQAREHNRMRRFGLNVEVVDTFERVDEILR